MLRPTVFILGLLAFTLTLTFTSDEFFEPKTTLGGYGELHLNYKSQQGQESIAPQLDFHRFILFASHSWTPRISLKSELELEHNFVKNGQGELELEQAYVDYLLMDWIHFQAGVLLPGVGLINEYHEPPLFLTVERPDYHKTIIPTTWFGNGVAFTGTANGQVEYKVTLMEGLNTAKVSAKDGIRGARQKGFESKLNNLLLNLKTDYTGVPGMRAGASYSRNHLMMNDTGNFQPYEAIDLFEGHLKVEKSGAHLAVEMAYINYTATSLPASLPEVSFGYYLNLGYNLGYMLGKSYQIIPWFYFGEYNPAFKAGTSAIESANETSEWKIGISFLPIPQLSFKMDYGLKFTGPNEVQSNLFNMGVGYFF